MAVKHPVDDKTAQRFIDYDYHDRGMMKWKGFMLSDHSEYIERSKHQHSVELLSTQSLSQIHSLIKKAMDKQISVIIQPNYLDYNDDQPIELVGKIKGIQDTEVYLRTKLGIESIVIESIRNLRFLDASYN